MKWDYTYAIGGKKPDVITQIYPYDQAKNYIDKEYRRVDFDEFYFYLKNGSHNIAWDKIPSH
jgi:hypothetical protein